MLVKNENGDLETTHVGDRDDTDYVTRGFICCEYRPSLNGLERYGIFARDNGNFA